MCTLRKIGAAPAVSPSEVLALDTNVLLWTFYPKLTPGKAYQTRDYPPFVTSAITRGNPIVVTSFCLNEMLNIVEKTEYDLFKFNTGSRISRKDFRGLPAERSKVQSQNQLILRQLQAIPNLQIVRSKANRKTIHRFNYYFNTHLADFFDFCLIEFCNRHNYSIVSDDRDFNSPFFKGVLYSANPHV